MTTEIRIPATTVAFIINLDKILREQAKCQTTSHNECWTLRKAGEWEVCQRQGKCPKHGIDYKRYTFSDEELDEIYAHYDCHEWSHSVYVGKGYITDWSRGGKVELRTKIEISEWFVIGHVEVDYHLWLRSQDGTIERFTLGTLGYGLMDYTRPSLDTGKIKQYPPNSISFW